MERGHKDSAESPFTAVKLAARGALARSIRPHGSVVFHRFHHVPGRKPETACGFDRSNLCISRLPTPHGRAVPMGVC